MIKARIGIINKTINMLDFLLAKDAGLYRKHGLEVEFDTLAGLRSIRALEAGELDVVVSIGAAIQVRMQEPLPLKMLLLVHRNAPHWVMGRTGIDSAGDLRGLHPGRRPGQRARRHGASLAEAERPRSRDRRAVELRALTSRLDRGRSFAG